MSVAIGSPAPTFSLMDQDRNTVTLDDLKGNNALIVFLPFPFTGICDAEACALRDHLAMLNAVDAKVVVITCHAVAIAKKWSDENSLTFPVLSDFWPHGTVATDYDAFNTTVGVANRVTVALDADGIVRSIIDSGSLGTGREFDEYVRALDAIDEKE